MAKRMFSALLYDGSSKWGLPEIQENKESTTFGPPRAQLGRTVVSEYHLTQLGMLESSEVRRESCISCN
jgi:hypothetical protein